MHKGKLAQAEVTAVQGPWGQSVHPKFEESRKPLHLKKDA